MCPRQDSGSDEYSPPRVHHGANLPCAPARTRTRNLRVRSATLYPIELQAQNKLLFVYLLNETKEMCD